MVPRPRSPTCLTTWGEGDGPRVCRSIACRQPTTRTPGTCPDSRPATFQTFASSTSPKSAWLASHTRSTSVARRRQNADGRATPVTSRYRFMLFRHWSVYESMFHTPYVASRLNIWAQNGKETFHKLLASMGYVSRPSLASAASRDANRLNNVSRLPSQGVARGDTRAVHDDGHGHQGAAARKAQGACAQHWPPRLSLPVVCEGGAFSFATQGATSPCAGALTDERGLWLARGTDRVPDRRVACGRGLRRGGRARGAAQHQRPGRGSRRGRWHGRRRRRGPGWRARGCPGRPIARGPPGRPVVRQLFPGLRRP